MEVYPAYFVALGLVVYAIAYLVYARWYDKNVWKPDPKATTPAHMYMDGVEFFPASRYVLYGFQFKGIAGAAPIVGPFVALSFGWIPALIWILVGNFFIGWIHDYSILMTGVRSEGKTVGPLSYEFIGSRARSCMLGFLLFYLIMITAAFFNVCGTLFSLRGGALIFMTFIVIGGLISGVLLYRLKMHIGIATIAGIIIMLIGLWLGSALYPLEKVIPFEWTVAATAVICFIGAVLPIIWFAQPVNYVAFYPCITGIILLIVGALASPLFGITVVPAAWVPPRMDVFGLWTPGPIWPLLCVSIACGAISGWHSLVGTSGSARQLDVETDGLPIGAGSMLTEGLLALSALGAYMAIASEPLIKAGSFWGFSLGASRLVGNLLAIGENNPALQTFFVAFIAIYAITVEQLVLRFFRIGLTEVTAPASTLRATIGNPYVGAFIGALIGYVFTLTGAWTHIWFLFGGSNQLMAGMALLLSTLYLAGVKRPTKYVLGPAIFMIVTCEAALIWEAIALFRLVLIGKPLVAGMLALPVYHGVALALTAIFGVIAIILLILGAVVAYDGFKALAKARAAEKAK